jgi:pyrimidine-nucleoside phosphorylase
MSFSPYEVILKKRDGHKISREEIAALVSGFSTGTVPDYQMAAFLMAVFFSGMDDDETKWLTETMISSGSTIDLSEIDDPKIDKHSTGGVGDKVSIALAPLVASRGIVVPMISGRGLGHTGGTLDKLESVPGFRCDFRIGEFIGLLQESGMAIISQSPELVPADKKMYALRDVTATVDCIPLIVASIISKKAAEGADAIVFDVKVGRGAFMKNESDGRRLAQSLVSIAGEMGKGATALLTRMDCPIGSEVGNLNEVIECAELLRGEGRSDLLELVLSLGSEMAVLSGLWGDRADGRRALEEALEDGSAYRKFEEFIRLQGGDVAALERSYEPPHRAEVLAREEGVVQDIDALSIGRATVSLGAGRTRVGEKVDPLAGVSIKRHLGDAVEKGDPLAVAFSSRDEIPIHVLDRISSAFVVGNNPPETNPVVIDRID